MNNTNLVSSARFEAVVTKVCSWFEWIGLAGMAIMALTALVDVLGTKLFGLPLPGSTEITAVVQIMAIAAGLAYSQIDGKQIRVDIILGFLPKWGKAVLDLFASLLGVVFFAIASWTSYVLGANLASSGTSTLLLGIPLAPFAFWLSLCCILMCVTILVELVNAIRGLAE
jgi:TRAP-type transport system small permease protein